MAFMSRNTPRPEDQPLLRELIRIPESVSTSDFVLKLNEAVTPEGAEAALKDYVVTDRLLGNFDEALDLIKSALDSRSSKAAYLHGSFGSGKSHFMAVLYALLSRNQAARARRDLDPVRARHSWLDADDRKFLLVPYHMLGSKSLEQRVLGKYVEHVRKLHPGCSLPQVYRTDGLFEDFAEQRRRNGDDRVIAQLADAGAGQEDEWGDSFAWTTELLDQAVNAPEEHENTKDLDLENPSTPRELRARLVQDLTQTLFPSFSRSASEDADGFVSLDTGLGIIAAHAKSLGYDGLVLFMDELILWLASRIHDQRFVSRESDKITNFVEGGDERRAIPVVSFIARQRDLRELVGEEMSGAAEAAVQDSLKLSGGRFDKVVLEDRNLPQIAQARLLKPATSEAEAKVNAAFAEAKKLGPDVWDTLLGHDKSTTGADEDAFRRTYPFPPAFMDTLVHISAALQRSRTGLKLMSQLLVDHRDDWRLGQLVPLGDLYPAIAGGGDKAFSGDTNVHFEAADKLYRDKLRPYLLKTNQVTEDQAEAYRRRPDTLGDPQLAARCRDFTGDSRLLQTVLLCALAPSVPALSDLTLARLHALNHGSITTRIAGTEVGRLEQKAKEWAATFPEIKVTGTGPGAVISLELTGVDLDAVLANAQVHNNEGNRRAKMRGLLKDALGISDGPGGFDAYDVLDLVWKGTERQVEVVFGNVAEVDSLPEATLRPSQDDAWRLVVDFPYDEGEFGPMDDLQRLRALREKPGGDSRTLAWLPTHLTDASRGDFERLVVIDKALADEARFDSDFARSLNADDKARAKSMLQSQLAILTERVTQALRQAYGLTQKQEGVVDLSFDTHLVAQQDVPELRPPLGAQLDAAARDLAGKLLTHQYPAHPDLDPDGTGKPIKPAEIRTVFEYVRKAAEDRDGQVEVDSKDRKTMARIAGSLGLGAMREAYYRQSTAWPDHFNSQARRDNTAEPTLVKLSDWSDLPEPRGLPEPLRRLLAAAYAETTDRVWVRGGVPVEPAPAPHELKRDYALREQQLPGENDWAEARKRFETVLGDRAPQLRRGRIVNQFAGQIKQAASALAQDAGRLVSELEKHRDFLQLSDDSPRLILARQAQELVKEVTEAGIEAKTIVDRLAHFDVGDFTAHRYGMSLKSAGKVASALQNTSWDQLGLADTLGVDGAAVLERVRDAAAGDPGDYPDLPGVLNAGGREVLSLLRSRQTTTERPQPPATAQPSSDDVDLNGGSAHPQVLPEPTQQPGPRTPSRSVARSGGGRTTAARAAAELQAEIAALAAAHPNATVEVVWKVVD
ncbi:BREX-2 system ATPase PglY [Streptomyces antarcticus]|uniref:BREX-2 system ATPase PglY n=1 Tax=Streptomyces antarcticus TaxID=2996458 RepID=UPI00227220FE|nr:MULTISPECIES: phage resistance protein [unclassified Streptomyces]MCY0943638.1 phage resistance protein [Streptomyces sp. H34-AA3]MCZ4080551.1 phage resistance protein [Streptomyces sp. H34-S5]